MTVVKPSVEILEQAPGLEGIYKAIILALVGYTIDIILSLLLCLVGYDESIGDAILHSLEGPEPLTAWIVFMVPFTLFLIHIFIVSCKSNDIEPIAIRHIPENLMRKIGKVNGNTVAKEFCPTTKDIDADYRNGQISREEANSRIKKRLYMAGIWLVAI